MTALETIAALWAKQVNDFDGLRRPSWPRRYVKFSPSQADACPRQLYYVNTNAPQDEGSVVPWKERRRRNGDGYHHITQEAHKRMSDELRKAGLPVNFEVVAQEVNGKARFVVDGREVVVEGRCDQIVRYVGEAIPGVVSPGDVILVDYKAKAKLSGVRGVQSRGVPSYTSQQMVAYSLLRFDTKDGERYENIDKVIVHYESLEKMKESEEESKDVYAVLVQATEADKRQLLVKFAKVVEAVEKGEVPAGDFEKCAFCGYKTVCGREEAK